MPPHCDNILRALEIGVCDASEPNPALLTRLVIDGPVLVMFSTVVGPARCARSAATILHVDAISLRQRRGNGTVTAFVTSNENKIMSLSAKWSA